jgi:hypothetical protein
MAFVSTFESCGLDGVYFQSCQADHDIIVLKEHMVNKDYMQFDVITSARRPSGSNSPIYIDTAFHFTQKGDHINWTHQLHVTVKSRVNYAKVVVDNDKATDMKVYFLHTDQMLYNHEFICIPPGKEITIVFEAEATTSTANNHLFDNAKIHFTGLEFADQYKAVLRPVCSEPYKEYTKRELVLTAIRLQ